MKKEKSGKHFLNKPEYPGGKSALLAFIQTHLQYPESAKAEKISGTVRVRYTINHLGKVVETKVLSGLGYGCDEEACRVVKLLKFTVGKNRGMRAQFHKTININFKAPHKKAVPSQGSTQIQYQITPSPSTTSPETKSKTTTYSYTIEIK